MDNKLFYVKVDLIANTIRNLLLGMQTISSWLPGVLHEFNISSNLTTIIINVVISGLILLVYFIKAIIVSCYSMINVYRANALEDLASLGVTHT